MTHRIIATVGLSFDIVGAVLVGVEAVKLENVRRFRQWTERQRTSLKGIFAQDGEFGYRSMVAWLAVYAAVFYGLYSLVLPHRARVPLVGSFLDNLVFASLVAGWIDYYLASVGLMLLNLVLVGVLAFVVAIVGAIDRNTPAGSVGILGVGALFVGFGLQLAATWLV